MVDIKGNGMGWEGEYMDSVYFAQLFWEFKTEPKIRYMYFLKPRWSFYERP